MWIQLHFHTFVLSCVVGKDGILYWRVVEIAQLCQMKRPYDLQKSDYVRNHSVTGGDVLTAGHAVQMKCRLVNTPIMFEILKFRSPEMLHHMMHFLKSGTFSVTFENVKHSRFYRECHVLRPDPNGVLFESWIIEFVQKAIDAGLILSVKEKPDKCGEEKVDTAPGHSETLDVVCLDDTMEDDFEPGNSGLEMPLDSNGVDSSGQDTQGVVYRNQTIGDVPDVVCLNQNVTTGDGGMADVVCLNQNVTTVVDGMEIPDVVDQKMTIDESTQTTDSSRDYIVALGELYREFEIAQHQKNLTLQALQIVNGRKQAVDAQLLQTIQKIFPKKKLLNAVFV